MIRKEKSNQYQMTLLEDFWILSYLLELSVHVEAAKLIIKLRLMLFNFICTKYPLSNTEMEPYLLQ